MFVLVGVYFIFLLFLVLFLSNGFVFGFVMVILLEILFFCFVVK